ncbi:1-acyl-sn-glycerol-3-phosphate acyltransferase [Abyssibius alkaniclasticus]|uniref:lysophospholipid acyltransferase family protein n=1 Tax=Abyssibius alkaniclasticus TaxID=2881234 RepID=UPI0023631B66|nr:1-acyl-sn-glycerol-3-phosphate acyltransferase [Abyssibius alkaniclasticus]UPH70788.1 1-acyl-sn-glycerol-3-phosphate acyltransferase [Abyssibius alkaniclasticus]
MAWGEGTEAPFAKIGVLGGLRFGLFAVIFVLGTLPLISLTLLSYMVERLTGGRGLSDVFIKTWGRMGRLLCGLKLEIRGTELAQGGAMVANHVSWSDIFVLHDAAHIHFVAKSEVKSWPGIGFLANATGTIFIERRATEAKRQQQQLKERLQKGDKLCFFPEGTSSDGRRVLPFKSALFSAFHTPELLPHMWVQPVSVTYFAPKSQAPRFFGWWGNMSFGGHMRTVFALGRGGRVRVTFHAPVRAADFADRKLLAAHCEAAVRAGMAADLAEVGQEMAVD